MTLREFTPQTQTTVKPNGESVTAPVPVRPLDLTKARRVSEVAGTQPAYINLRDHPELDGKELAIIGVETDTGDYGDYVRLVGYVLPEQTPMVIMTGAANVYSRARAIQQAVSFETPIIGTLKRIGDAWLLD